MAAIQVRKAEDDCIAAKIEHIQELCLYPNHADTATALIHDRLIAPQQILANITEPITDIKRLVGLYDVLNGLQRTLVRVLSMNRIVHAVQSIQILDQLQASLGLLDSSVESLLETQSNAQGPWRQSWQDHLVLCQKQAQLFADIRQTLQQEQSKLALSATGEEFAAALRESVGAVSANEIQEALTVLELDHRKVTEQLSKSNIHPQARAKAFQYMGFAGLVIERLQGQVPEPEYPDWALDPFTGQPMEDPVRLRADCAHAVDISTFVRCILVPNASSCLCGAKLKGMFARPDKELAQRIGLLKGVSTMDESTSSTDLTPAIHRIRGSITQSSFAQETIAPKMDKSASPPSRRKVTFDLPEEDHTPSKDSAAGQNGSKKPEGSTASSSTSTNSFVYPASSKPVRMPKWINAALQRKRTGVPVLRVKLIG